VKNGQDARQPKFDFALHTLQCLGYKCVLLPADFGKMKFMDVESKNLNFLSREYALMKEPIEMNISNAHIYGLSEYFLVLAFYLRSKTHKG